MNIFIAHSLNDSFDSIDLYSFEKNNFLVNNIDNLNQLPDLSINDTLIFLISSSFVSSYKFIQNSDLPPQINLANFVSDIDLNLVGQVSDNSFLFHEDNGFVLNKSSLDMINGNLTNLNSNIYLMPEHSLLGSRGADEIFEIGYKFIFSYSDGTGFSVSEDSLKQYVEVLINTKPDFEPLIYSSNTFLSETFPSSTFNKNISFDEFLHKDLSFLPNFFKFTFSFNNIKNKFNFTKSQLGICLLSLLILIGSPKLLIYQNNTNAALYKSATFNIFKSINKDINRVVAPRVQIDEIIKQAPDQMTSLKTGIPNLNFLDQLDNRYFKSAQIDLKNQSAELMINDMPSLQYKFIKTLSTQFNVVFIDDSTVSLDGLINGKLILGIGNE